MPKKYKHNFIYIYTHAQIFITRATERQILYCTSKCLYIFICIYLNHKHALHVYENHRRCRRHPVWDIATEREGREQTYGGSPTKNASNQPAITTKNNSGAEEEGHNEDGGEMGGGKRLALRSTANKHYHHSYAKKKKNDI